MDHNEYVAKTAAHYTKQWGTEFSFGEFVQTNPDAAKVIPSRQLPWGELFERIRSEAERREVSVYDAACGYGDTMKALTAAPNPSGLSYFGMDLHEALAQIEAPANATFAQGDITQDAGRGQFDFVICRAAIHHTPDPAATYRTLASQVRPGGTIAISAYARKSPMREAIDDALRAKIVPLDADEAFKMASQFTQLGRQLQAAGGVIAIKENLPLLGIRQGVYTVQEFIYQYFIKCWHNAAFSEQHCDLVNFDWYHPPYAFRYQIYEMSRWATECGLGLQRTGTTEAQHYMEAIRPRL